VRGEKHQGKMLMEYDLYYLKLLALLLKLSGAETFTLKRPGRILLKIMSFWTKFSKL
jgi:hypothetical protein